MEFFYFWVFDYWEFFCQIIIDLEIVQYYVIVVIVGKWIVYYFVIVDEKFLVLEKSIVYKGVIVFGNKIFGWNQVCLLINNLYVLGVEVCWVFNGVSG